MSLQSSPFPGMACNDKMGAFKHCPPEILEDIMEPLVVTIGIQKAVLLRTVCRGFDSALLHAICARQVVDMNDPATPDLAKRMHPKLRGKIILRKSKTATASCESYLRVVLKISQAFEHFCPGLDIQLLASRNESVAAAVIMDNLESVDEHVETQNLLSAACIVGDVTMLESVLKHDDCVAGLAGVDGTTPYFDSCLTLAAMGGHVDMVCFLLEHGAESRKEIPSWKKHSSLQVQADWADHDDYQRRSCLFKRDPSALRAATIGGHTEIVHILLEPNNRMPENSLEYLRVVLAGSKAGRLDLIEAVFTAIDKRLEDFEGLGEDMMWEAIRGDHMNIVEMLLNQGVDPNAYPRSCTRSICGTLHLAASLGRLSLIRLLIARGAVVNTSTPKSPDSSPVAGAAWHGQEEALALLLDYGADPELALWSAVQHAQPRVVRYLLLRYPELERRNDGELLQQVFGIAMSVSELRTISLLVEVAGIDLNHELARMGLPMDVAKKLGCPPLVMDHLISLGAQDTGGEVAVSRYPYVRRSIHISERTWEWLSRY